MIVKPNNCMSVDKDYKCHPVKCMVGYIKNVIITNCN